MGQGDTCCFSVGLEAEMEKFMVDPGVGWCPFLSTIHHSHGWNKKMNEMGWDAEHQRIYYIGPPFFVKDIWNSKEIDQSE